MTVLLVILIIIAVILICVNIRIVPQGYVFVIEHLGRYKTSW